MTRPLIFSLLDAPVDVLGLTLIEKAVLCSLVSHLNAKRNGTEVWPSIDRLMRLTGASRSAVKRAMRRFDELGLVKTRSDTGRTNVYSINVDAIRHRVDPVHGGLGRETDPVHGGLGTRSTENQGGVHRGPRTAKEQPIGTANGFSSFGCSTNLKVSDGDQQRKIAFVSLVDQAVDGMRLDRPEQPNFKKTGDDAA